MNTSPHKLPSKPVVVMQSVQHRNGHKPAAQRPRPSQRWIRIRNPFQPLMNLAVIISADEFRERTPKMPFIPDQQSVQTLPAKRPYQPLDVCRRIGCPIWNGDPPNSHLNPQPCIVCRSTRNSLPFLLHSQRTTELYEYDREYDLHAGSMEPECLEIQ